jgi:hypothetical protein
MSDSVNLKCVYVIASDSGSLVVEGRTRLFGISSAGNTEGGGFVNLTLKNGSSSGDTRLIIATSHSAFGTVGYSFQSNAPYIDLQSCGILFEDGIYFSADSGFYGASFFIEGGKDNT